jgi:hypothetical protein
MMAGFSAHEIQQLSKSGAMAAWNRLEPPLGISRTLNEN